MTTLSVWGFAYSPHHYSFLIRGDNVMEFRYAVIGDAQRIYKLICNMESKALDFEMFKSIFPQYVDNDNHYWIVACKRDSMYGFITLRTEYQLHHAAKIAEIMELVVDSTVRSMGIGKKLFEKASTLAKDNGCIQIEVCCNQLRTRTHGFYEKQDMTNSHYKFSKNLLSNIPMVNKLGI